MRCRFLFCVFLFCYKPDDLWLASHFVKVLRGHARKDPIYQLMLSFPIVTAGRVDQRGWSPLPDIPGVSRVDPHSGLQITLKVSASHKNSKVFTLCYCFPQDQMGRKELLIGKKAQVLTMRLPQDLADTPSPSRQRRGLRCSLPTCGTQSNLHALPSPSPGFLPVPLTFVWKWLQHALRVLPPLDHCSLHSKPAPSQARLSPSLTPTAVDAWGFLSPSQLGSELHSTRGFVCFSTSKKLE